MKIIICLMIIPYIIFGQIEWIEHLIEDSSIWFIESISACDLDEDGDMDILSSGESPYPWCPYLIWWENDGNGNFTKALVDTFVTFCIYTDDIDLDGDLDLLASGIGFEDDWRFPYFAIGWWENDGNENFTRHPYFLTVLDDILESHTFPADLDGDNDTDILGLVVQSWDETNLFWLENNGSGEFSMRPIYREAKKDLPPSFNCALHAIDLDKDNDVDILARYRQWFFWLKNDGHSNPNFYKYDIDSILPRSISASACIGDSIYPLDMNNDNNVDILGDINQIVWYENDGEENFTMHIIDPDFYPYIYGYGGISAVDLDNNDVLDVLVAGDDLVWWKNVDGLGTSWQEYLISYASPNSAYPIDFDKDGDVDILGGHGTKIIWYESRLIYFDISMNSIDIPSVLHADTCFNPQVTVKNLGSNFETFDVVCLIIGPSGYSSTETVMDLAPGDSVQVTFPDEFTFGIGSYTIMANVQLIGDQNTINDTLSMECEAIYYHDVSPISINIADTIPEGQLIPKASVKNLGIHQETFEITCAITPGSYISPYMVTNLIPNDTTEISFASVNLGEGTYIVTIYTRLENDDNLSNDTLSKEVVIYNPGIEEENSIIPKSFSFGLKTNPVRGKALFKLSLPEASQFVLTIYDISGRMVDKISETKQAGYYNLPWDSNVQSGIYFYKFESPYKNEVGKLVLVR